MRKIFALLLALALALTLVSCGDKNDAMGGGTTEPTNSTTETINDPTDGTESTTETTLPATAPSATEPPVTNPSATTPPATTPPATTPPATTPPTTTPPATTPPATTPPATTPPATEPAHTHSYSSRVTAPTCTVGGYTTHTCACGHSYVGDYTNPTNHTYSKKVTAATCTTQGYTTYTCTCGHSYIGDQAQPLGHNYKAATCKQPKTCSACGKTEGTTVDHILNANKVCKWCLQVVAIDPSSFNANIAYTYVGEPYRSEHLPGVDCYVWTILNFRDGRYSGQSGVHTQSDSPVDDNGYVLQHHHNGKYYYNIAQASYFGGETTYQIVGSEIVAHFASEGEETANTIHFILLSDGTLKVTAVYGYELSEHTKIPVGAVFFPNSKPYPREE